MLEEVSVSVQDLQVIRATLSSAYYQNTALDLLDSYRKLGQRQSHSALTKSLQGAADMVQAYIDDAIEEGDHGEQ